MSRWNEQYKVHAIHATLEWLHESASKEFDDIDENEISEKRRFIKTINKYISVLSDLDPEIVPFNQLDSLNTALRNPNVTNQINAYTQNGTVANLAAASDQLTNQLSVLSLLLSLAENVPVQNPIVDLEQLIDSATSTLVGKKDVLSAELEKLGLSVEEKEEKLVVLSKLIDQKSSEMTTSVNQWQNQFSTAQESRSQEFSKWRDNFSTEKGAEVDLAIQQFEEKLEKSSESFSVEINDILNDGNDKHQSILELYEITAGDSVGAGYLKNANDEKKQADNWRKISVSFIALTVAWLLFSFFYNTSHMKQVPTLVSPVKASNEQSEVSKSLDVKKQKFDTENLIKVGIDYEKGTPLLPWYTLFVTFSLSGVLLWGSAYAGQQSTKHRNNEKQTRWFALEVRAIDPFINSLETSDKNELKKQLSEKMFGQSFNRTTDDVKVIDEHVFKTVANTLGTILSKIPK